VPLGEPKGYVAIRIVAFALLKLPVACAQDTSRAPATLQAGDLVYRARVRTVVDSVVVAGHGPVGRPGLQAAVTVTDVGRRALRSTSGLAASSQRSSSGRRRAMGAGRPAISGRLRGTRSAGAWSLSALPG
jgi:hypothetical protein